MLCIPKTQRQVNPNEKARCWTIDVLRLELAHDLNLVEQHLESVVVYLYETTRTRCIRFSLKLGWRMRNVRGRGGGVRETGDDKPLQMTMRGCGDKEKGRVSEENDG